MDPFIEGLYRNGYTQNTRDTMYDRDYETGPFFTFLLVLSSIVIPLFLISIVAFCFWNKLEKCLESLIEGITDRNGVNSSTEPKMIYRDPCKLRQTKNMDGMNRKSKLLHFVLCKGRGASSKSKELLRKIRRHRRFQEDIDAESCDSNFINITEANCHVFAKYGGDWTEGLNQSERGLEKVISTPRVKDKKDRTKLKIRKGSSGGNIINNTRRTLSKERRRAQSDNSLVCDQQGSYEGKKMTNQRTYRRNCRHKSNMDKHTRKTTATLTVHRQGDGTNVKCDKKKSKNKQREETVSKYNGSFINADLDFKIKSLNNTQKQNAIIKSVTPFSTPAPLFVMSDAIGSVPFGHYGISHERFKRSCSLPDVYLPPQEMERPEKQVMQAISKNSNQPVKDLNNSEKYFIDNKLVLNHETVNNSGPCNNLMIVNRDVKSGAGTDHYSYQNDSRHVIRALDNSRLFPNTHNDTEEESYASSCGAERKVKGSHLTHVSPNLFQGDQYENTKLIKASGFVRSIHSVPEPDKEQIIMAQSLGENHHMTYEDDLIVSDSSLSSSKPIKVHGRDLMKLDSPKCHIEELKPSNHHDYHYLHYHQFLKSDELNKESIENDRSPLGSCYNIEDGLDSSVKLCWSNCLLASSEKQLSEPITANSPKDAVSPSYQSTGNVFVHTGREAAMFEVPKDVSPVYQDTTRPFNEKRRHNGTVYSFLFNKVISSNISLFFNKLSSLRPRQKERRNQYSENGMRTSKVKNNPKTTSAQKCNAFQKKTHGSRRHLGVFGHSTYHSENIDLGNENVKGLKCIVADTMVNPEAPWDFAKSCVSNCKNKEWKQHPYDNGLGFEFEHSSHQTERVNSRRERVDAMDTDYVPRVVVETNYNMKKKESMIYQRLNSESENRSNFEVKIHTEQSYYISWTENCSQTIPTTPSVMDAQASNDGDDVLTCPLEDFESSIYNTCNGYENKIRVDKNSDCSDFYKNERVGHKSGSIGHTPCGLEDISVHRDVESENHEYRQWNDARAEYKQCYSGKNCDMIDLYDSNFESDAAINSSSKEQKIQVESSRNTDEKFEQEDQVFEFHSNNKFPETGMYISNFETVEVKDSVMWKPIKRETLSSSVDEEYDYQHKNMEVETLNEVDIICNTILETGSTGDLTFNEPIVGIPTIRTSDGKLEGHDDTKIDETGVYKIKCEIHSTPLEITKEVAAIQGINQSAPKQNDDARRDLDYIYITNSDNGLAKHAIFHEQFHDKLALRTTNELSGHQDWRLENWKGDKCNETDNTDKHFENDELDDPTLLEKSARQTTSINFNDKLEYLKSEECFGVDKYNILESGFQENPGFFIEGVGEIASSNVEETIKYQDNYVEHQIRDRIIEPNKDSRKKVKNSCLIGSQSFEQTTGTPAYRNYKEKCKGSGFECHGGNRFNAVGTYERSTEIDGAKNQMVLDQTPKYVTSRIIDKKFEYINGSKSGQTKSYDKNVQVEVAKDRFLGPIKESADSSYSEEILKSQDGKIEQVVRDRNIDINSMNFKDNKTKGSIFNGQTIAINTLGNKNDRCEYEAETQDIEQTTGNLIPYYHKGNWELQLRDESNDTELGDTESQISEYFSCNDENVSMTLEEDNTHNNVNVMSSASCEDFSSSTMIGNTTYTLHDVDPYASSSGCSSVYDNSPETLLPASAVVGRFRKMPFESLKNSTYSICDRCGDPYYNNYGIFKRQHNELSK